MHHAVVIKSRYSNMVPGFWKRHKIDLFCLLCKDNAWRVLYDMKDGTFQMYHTQLTLELIEFLLALWSPELGNHSHHRLWQSVAEALQIKK